MQTQTLAEQSCISSKTSEIWFRVMLQESALDSSSTKVRTGDPVDDDEDYELPIWAGVVPMRTVMDAPVGDGRSPDGVDVPDNVQALSD